MEMKRHQYVFVLVAAVAASLAFGLQPASANAPQLLGGLHLLEYCQAHGWDTVVFPRGQLAPHAAVDNWACASGDESIPISMEQACKWEYGREAVQARFTDSNDAFTWGCYAVGTG
jgi:hypothetical protein